MDKWETTKIKLDSEKNEICKFRFKTYSVNTKGNPVDETEFDAESNIVCKRIYRYFDTGEVKEYIEYDPFDELLERHQYKKNDFGEVDRSEFEFEGGLKSIKEFSYTDIGCADKAVIKDENGTITGYEVYKFDEEGNVIEEIELDADNNEIAKFEKTYYENGVLHIEKHYQDGQLFTGESFEYDNRGNIIKKILRNYRDSYEIVDEYKFDQNNNMIYNSSTQNGVLVFENKCQYDSNNKLISEEFFEMDFSTAHVVRHERLIHALEV
ncbi:MAG: hypothetical protein MI922_10785 [Bacteroidales bacterium]|nr:hypothetical protein [Bacteroidales bacterium]